MTITATQLKQQTYLIDNVIKEDVHISKRGRPFAVLISEEKYNDMLKAYQSTNNNMNYKSKALEEFRRLRKNVSEIDPNINILDVVEEPRVGWDEKFKNSDSELLIDDSLDTDEWDEV